MSAYPHNIEAEQAIVGGILFNNGFYGTAAGLVRPEHFFEAIHAQIMAECGRLIAAGKKATPITVKDAFRTDLEVGEGVTIFQYLVRLARDGVTTAFELEEFSRRVIELANMRSMIIITDDLMHAAQDGIAPDVAVADAWERLDNVRSDARPDDSERGPIATLAPRLLEEGTAEAVAPTNLHDLDRVIAGGFRAGRLYVAAGRPGMGKTIFVTSAARRVARNGFGVSIFSLEIDTNEVTARLASDAASKSYNAIPYRDIVAKTVDPGARHQLEQAVERISALPIQIDASGGLSIAEIEARARVHSERFRKVGRSLGLIAIDYLGLIKAPERYRGQRVHELGEIAFAAKTMAKRLQCAVLLMSQLNRAVEGRDDKRPTLSDLRDSGNIEEHADMVALLYREHYYLIRSPDYLAGNAEALAKEESCRNRLEFIVGKNRLGPTKVVELWCNVAHSAIDNAARHA